MSVNLTPNAKLIVEFPDGDEITLWVKDLKIDPPGMERDELEIESWNPSLWKTYMPGPTRLTDGKIEATITNAPDDKIPAYKSNQRPSMVSYPRLEKQLKEAEERREYWRNLALKREKEKEILKAEMEDIIQRKEKKSFPPYATLRKEDWQVLDNAILAAARSRLREWKENPPEKETRLPWIERALKRAIEWCVDVVLWVW